MCIAIYKPMGTRFPNKKILERCFRHNPDGAGFMVATGKEVEIHKGFMGFRSFWKALRDSRAKYGDRPAYVMHFRVSTQGGIRQDGCHPFPLSGAMADMRKLDTTCEIGIAHNGIIALCSSGLNRAKVDYSDTMEFITEYLSLIIRGKKYYKHKETLELIEKLCGSRLAILDRTGHCELIGYGWEMSEGVWYSNGSYREREILPATTCYDWSWGYGDANEETDSNDTWEVYYEKFFDFNKGGYDFEPGACPLVYTGDAGYCDYCLNFKECCK